MLLVMLICAGCGAATAPPVATPSPTIAGAALRPSPTPLATSVAPPPSSPAALSPSANAAVASALPAATTVKTSTFVYLWPAYLPAGMQVSPTESRIARAGELGEGGIGFFIITFKAGTQKLVVGGGSTETLPLTGDQRRVVVGARQATLTTNGDQRQVVFEQTSGSLFVYSFGLSEEELLRVAGSLAPIDVAEMRNRAGVQ